MFSLKKATLVAVTGALLVAPAVASASTSATSTAGLGWSPGNATYQAGHVAVPFEFGFDASNPTAPKGEFTFDRPDGSFQATVTHYTQVGNQAAFSGPITHGTGIFAHEAGDYAYFGVEDNGNPTKDAIQVDIGSQYANSAPIASTVSSWTNPYPYQVALGAIEMH
jgi:hypothetical protein